MIRLIAAVALLLSGAAHAQRAVYTVWDLSGSTVLLALSLPHATAQTLVAGGPAATGRAVAEAVAAHTDVHQGAEACPPVDQGPDVGRIDALAPAPGLLRYEIIFQCPRPLTQAAAGTLRLDDHLGFDRAPRHLDLAQIRRPGTAPVVRLVDAANQSIALAPGAALAATGGGAYAWLGARTALGSASRLACVLAFVLCLAANRRRRAAWMAAAGLAAGTLLCLALTVPGPITLRASLAGSVIGAITVLLAARATAPRMHRPQTLAWILATLLGALALAELAAGHSADAALLTAPAAILPWFVTRRTLPDWVWLIPGMLFGALNGASFAAAYAGIAQPPHAALLPAASYQAGALLACAAIAAALTAAATLLRRWPPTARALPAELAAAALAGAGLFWFASQLHA